MKKFNFVIALIAALILAAAGCSSGTGTSASPSASSSASASASPSASGINVNVTGADYIQPLIAELGSTYMTNNPGINVQTAVVTSNAAIAQCADAGTDMALSSRHLKDIEKTTFTGMTEKVLCMDGIVIVVGKDSIVHNLTAEQVKNIFIGVIDNWSQVGGAAGTIRVYTMSSDSDIRKAFNAQFLGTSEVGKQIDTDDSVAKPETTTAELITALEGDPLGVGYLPLTALTKDTSDKIKAVDVDNVTPTSISLTNGSYPYLLNYIIMTRNPKAEASAFLAYVNGSDAAAVIKGKGLIIP